MVNKLLPAEDSEVLCGADPGTFAEVRHFLVDILVVQHRHDPVLYDHLQVGDVDDHPRDGVWFPGHCYLQCNVGVHCSV